ncbi:Valine--tRNA ligase [Pirellulimonas nuda]|uniref:Valine--tRNA ligase n=1 Tax=Pirellulimonas nuda TaxID=2528009 RepID=A0A518DHU0_9BACT|nr:valine--tRNA ligase [Pirellulimonas nuda]QDU91047.1 Valine--tRNA ligase [Pirellulimonas nuda]
MPTTDFKALPAQYDHTAAQTKWYAFWEERGYFHPDPKSKKPPFSIVIPPPNVTGALHLGHALNNTLQDVLCRMKRMQGFNVLWQPGTDHAGIATQAVVERRLLAEEKLSRHDLGREGLVERIWKWKEQYEARIIGQLKQLGCSCDWQRVRFTLDDQCARAVRETFFKLFADGKVYRGKRLVNWDTFLQTAVSDDEVFHEETKGFFWRFRYPVIDAKPGEPTHVEIATTRPETMLGDTAVAVHPDPAKALDAVEAELKEKLAAAPVKEKAPIETHLKAIVDRRKSHLPLLLKLRDMAARGVMLELPLTDRKIPLILDEWAKPELGSGCVKITPAHDPNDYEVGQRHAAIGAVNILLTDGTLNDSVPEKYRGLTMKDARKAVVADLEALGLHDPEAGVEDRLIDLAHSDRSKTPIEPYLADQWFIKMDELAQSAMDAVTDGRVKITPERYGKTYLDWLSEKRDWPVGRQLWWGHRIPVWKVSRESYSLEWEGVELNVQMIGERHPTVPISIQVVGETALVATSDDYHSIEARSVTSALEELGFNREDDVLDTWFSSALWPHSTLGWPDDTPELEAFYPTSVLITSRDIITLWVARMVLMGLYNTGKVPFPQVYIHPKILDGFGETMSKSKGNGVDPLDVIERFGADALRFGLAYLTTETQDVRLPVEFVCPHCEAAIPQTKKNRVLPRVECPKCHEEFSTQWAEKPADTALPRGAVTSERFELGRNFATKLWNASRFALINLEGYKPAPVKPLELLVEDRWLLSRLAAVTGEVSEALEAFRFADAARALYDFAWNDFCSFYLEMTKARFADDAQKPVAQRVLAHTLDALLRLLHPMMPFLTEEVWGLLGEAAPLRGLTSPAQAGESVCVASWPTVDAEHIDPTIEQQFAVFQAVLGAVREARQGQNIPNKEPVEFAVRCDAASAKLLEPMQPYFTQMARATGTTFGPDAEAPSVSASKTLPGLEVYVDIARFIDVGAERERLDKEQQKLAGFLKGIEAKLANEKFVAGAPAEVVQQQRDKMAEVRGQLDAIEAAQAKLKG